MPVTPKRPSSGTLICFDYGLKNIGCALGEAEFESASEHTIFKARDGVPNWDEIGALLAEWQPVLVLVGKPINMDGSASELSRRATKFGNRLNGRFGVAVEMVDERLTSREAKAEAAHHQHRGRYAENPVDAIAARIILQSWYQMRSDDSV